jgi:hypothetical protein
VGKIVLAHSGPDTITFLIIVLLALQSMKDSTSIRRVSVWSVDRKEPRRFLLKKTVAFTKSEPYADNSHDGSSTRMYG